uniref:Uncharacterized protein n=1 Tax=Attheya septentrionalis TaxID=420275 RepID=A0A7S2XKH2_9STRA
MFVLFNWSFIELIAMPTHESSNVAHVSFYKTSEFIGIILLTFALTLELWFPWPLLSGTPDTILKMGGVALLVIGIVILKRIESTRTASFTWYSNHQAGQERTFSMVSKSHVHCNYLHHCASTRFTTPKYMDLTASSHLPDSILLRLDSGGRDISERVISRGVGGLLCQYTPLALMTSTRNLKYGSYE